MLAAAPTPDTFASLDEARALLRVRFGYPDFRPPQIRAVQAVLAHRDALIVLPTGGGKSLCYQVPALLRSGLTIVVSPLISLMKDQVDALARRGIAAAFVNSTLSAGDVANRLAQARDGTLRLLYLAPERMDGSRLVQQLIGIGVSMLAVDEAHCISEWGHDFRPSYRRIGLIRERLGMPHTVALTATATPSVRADIIRQLALRRPAVVVGGFDRTNLTYHVVPTRTQPDKDRAAVTWLREAHGPAIVYAPTRRAVERVTSVLVRQRVQAVAYHAGLDDGVRQRAQNAFMHERARVIVATSAFGMGIDKPDVRLVVHHAMPGSLEAYYQEAGRAGRDGQPSTCVLLYSYPDRFTHEFFIDGAHPDRTLVERTWRLLRQRGDAAHVVTATAADLAECLPDNVGERQVAAAIRVLGAAGALSVQPPVAGRVWLRLLATPDRITRELVGARSFDREVLRALWRGAGSALQSGTIVDLDGLPPGLMGSTGMVPVLERLESEQFLTWSRKGGGLRLDRRCRVASWLPVDWHALERRRQAELSRLEAMQGYSQTRACRRAFVLRYFGDPDARSHCHAYDRCLGIPADRSEPVLTRAAVARSRLRRH